MEGAEVIMDLQAKIRQIVHENSGGVKLVQLLTELAAESYKADRRVLSADDVMLCIDEDPTLNAHGYVWYMGSANCDVVAASREKVFVHQV